VTLDQHPQSPLMNSDQCPTQPSTKGDEGNNILPKLQWASTPSLTNGDKHPPPLMRAHHHHWWMAMSAQHHHRWAAMSPHDHWWGPTATIDEWRRAPTTIDNIDEWPQAPNSTLYKWQAALTTTLDQWRPTHTITLAKRRWVPWWLLGPTTACLSPHPSPLPLTYEVVDVILLNTFEFHVLIYECWGCISSY